MNTNKVAKVKLGYFDLRICQEMENFHYVTWFGLSQDVYVTKIYALNRPWTLWKSWMNDMTILTLHNYSGTFYENTI